MLGIRTGAVRVCWNAYVPIEASCVPHRVTGTPLLLDSQLPTVLPPHLLLASQQPGLPFPLASPWLLLLLLLLLLLRVLLPQPSLPLHCICITGLRVRMQPATCCWCLLQLCAAVLAVRWCMSVVWCLNVLCDQAQYPLAARLAL